MQNIRLVALDLDGTVFNDKKEITPRTLAALRAACAQGVVVLPATGRTASGVPAAFTSNPGVQYALTSNGARVVNQLTGEQLENQPAPQYGHQRPRRYEGQRPAGAGGLSGTCA